MVYLQVKNDDGGWMLVHLDDSKHSVKELIPNVSGRIIIVDVPAFFGEPDMFTVKRMGRDGDFWKEIDHIMMTRKRYGDHLCEWQQVISSTHRNSRDTRDYIELMEMGWEIAGYTDADLRMIFSANKEA